MVTGPAGRVAVASAIWALGACAVASLGLFERLLADDAYYYFEVARNAARGEGLSFDSVAPTNGYHPLWVFVLVPLYALLPESQGLPIHLALGFSALCVPVTALGVQRLFAWAGAPRAGELAAYAWLFNPFTVVLAFRGVEAPMAALLLWTSLALLVRARSAARWTPRECAFLGASIGALFLARTDAVLWAAVVGSVVAWDLVASGRARAVVSRGLTIAAAAAGVALPWLAWNLATFGSVVQTSVQAKVLFHLYGRLPPLVPAELEGLARWLAVPIGAAYNLLLTLLVDFRFATGEEWTELRRGAVLFALAVVWTGGVAVAALRLRRRPPTTPCGSGRPGWSGCS